ncbi:hypothetical protein M9458_013036, partial [Cirrhinus mrigala]
SLCLNNLPFPPSLLRADYRSAQALSGPDNRAVYCRGFEGCGCPASRQHGGGRK